MNRSVKRARYLQNSDVFPEKKNVTLILLAVSLRITHAAPECATARHEPVASTYAKIETKARAKAEDVCPDRNATASTTEKTQLLEAIRKSTLASINPKLDPGTGLPDAEVLQRFTRMRAFMALRQSDVLVKGDHFVVTPDVKPRHARGFADLAPLSAAEGADLQRTVGPVVDLAQDDVKHASPERRRVATAEAGNELRASLREAGRAGYERLVAQTPLLLYVGKDGDLARAKERFQAARKAEAKALFKLDTAPPDGLARSLIYFGPITTKVLAENPKLCGAFHSIRRELQVEADLVGFYTSYVGMASIGTCLAASAFSSGLFGAICLGFGAQEVAGRVYDSLTTSYRANLLYASTLAGAGSAEYENANRELTGKVLATVGAVAPLSALAVAKVPGLGMKTGAGAVAERDLVAQEALFSSEGRVKPPPAAEVVPTDAYAPYRKGYARHGFSLKLEPEPLPGTHALVKFDDREVTLFEVKSPFIEPTPHQRGSLAHEAQHVRAVSTNSPSSRISIRVEKPSYFDDHLGSYGKDGYFGADEPVAHYYGGITEHKLSGEPSYQAQRGQQMAWRIDQLLRPVSRAAGERHGILVDDHVYVPFQWSAKDYLSPTAFREAQRLYPDVSERGEYWMAVKVRPNQSEHEALVEAGTTLGEYMRDLRKARSNFVDIEKMNPNIYPKPDAP